MHTKALLFTLLLLSNLSYSSIYDCGFIESAANLYVQFIDDADFISKINNADAQQTQNLLDAKLDKAIAKVAEKQPNTFIKLIGINLDYETVQQTTGNKPDRIKAIYGEAINNNKKKVFQYFHELKNEVLYESDLILTSKNELTKKISNFHKKFWNYRLNFYDNKKYRPRVIPFKGVTFKSIKQFIFKAILRP